MKKTPEMIKYIFLPALLTLLLSVSEITHAVVTDDIETVNDFTDIPISPETIIPRPQHIAPLSEAVVSIDASWKIVVDSNNDDDMFAAAYLKDEIKKAAGGMELGIVDASLLPATKRIIIGNPHTNQVIYEIAFQSGIDVDTALANDFEQGYVLLIRPGEISILAKSNTGTFYGMISLTWLLKAHEGSIIMPHTKITDWPDLKVRGSYSGGTWDWNGTRINTDIESGQEAWINVLTKYKYNLWTHGIYRRLEEGSSQQKVDKLLAREQFLKQRHFFTSVVLQPMSAPSYDSNLREGVWISDARAVFDGANIAQPIVDDPIMQNGDFEIDNNGDNFPDNWYQANNGDPRTYWLRDSTDVHSGGFSAKLTLGYDLTGTKSSAILVNGTGYQDRYVDLKPGSIYELSLWAKKDLQNSGGQTQVTCVLCDKDKTALRGASVTFEGNNNVWEQCITTFDSSNGATKMYIYSRAQSTKALTLHIDDLRVVNVGARMVNIIENETTWIEIWDKDRTIQYREGLDYAITRTGTLSLSDPMSGKTIEIRRLAGGGILPHAEISVSYDFLPKMKQRRNEPMSCADPATLTTYRDKVVKPTLERVTPDFVFIGMDEVQGFNRDSRSRRLGLENHELMAQFLNNVVDVIHSYGENIKVLIWDDMLSPYHNGGERSYQVNYGGQYGRTFHALDSINKNNVALVSWWYDDDRWKKMENSPALYNQLGLQFLGGPWDNVDNIKFWSYLCYRNNALGIVGHEFYDRISGVIPTANYSWNALKVRPTSVNNPPAISYVPDQTVKAGSTVEFPIEATDADGNIVTFKCLEPFPERASIIDDDPGDNHAIFRWVTTADDAGEHLITIVADDGSGAQIPGNLVQGIPQDIKITVTGPNRPPVLTTIGNQVVTEVSALTFTLSAADPDGDTLAYSAADLPAGAVFDTDTKTFTWTPSHGQEGSYNETFMVSDGSLTDYETITINVTEPDPVISIGLNMAMWQLGGVKPGETRDNLDAAGIPIHNIVNSGNVPVKVGIKYVSPADNTLILPGLGKGIDTFITMVKGIILPAQEEIVLPDTITPGAYARLPLTYGAPTALSQKTSGMSVTYEIRAYKGTD